jgi:hypothetical protein
MPIIRLERQLTNNRVHERRPGKRVYPPNHNNKRLNMVIRKLRTNSIDLGKIKVCKA